MQPVKALLSIHAKTGNAPYNQRPAGPEVFIPVEVNQVDYNFGGDTRLFRCVLPGKDVLDHDNILWVPLDSLRDEHYRPLDL